MSEQLGFNPDTNTTFSSSAAIDALQMLMPTPETPVSPRLHGEQGAINLEVFQAGIDRGALAVLGLRKVITEGRLHRAQQAEKEANELLITGAVRGEAAEAALDQRAPAPDLTPLTKSEMRAGRKASRRRTKIMKANVEAIRLRSNYGSQDMRGEDLFHSDVHLTQFHTRQERNKRGEFEDKAEREKYQREADAKRPINTGQFALPPSFANDLGTPAQKDRLAGPGRYPKARIRAELRAARQLRRTERVAQKYGGRVKRTVEGNDIVGRNIRGHVEHRYDRANELTARLQDLEQRTEQKREAIEVRSDERKASKEQRKAERSSKREQKRQDRQSAKEQRKAQRAERRERNRRGVI